jgi:hypothetical protein
MKVSLPSTTTVLEWRTRDADPAGEAYLAVNDQYLAMISESNASRLKAPSERAKRRELVNLSACLDEQRPEGPRRPPGRVTSTLRR